MHSQSKRKTISIEKQATLLGVTIGVFMSSPVFAQSTVPQGDSAAPIIAPFINNDSTVNPNPQSTFTPNTITLPTTAPTPLATPEATEPPNTTAPLMIAPASSAAPLTITPASSANPITGVPAPTAAPTTPNIVPTLIPTTPYTSTSSDSSSSVTPTPPVQFPPSTGASPMPEMNSDTQPIQN